MVCKPQHNETMKKHKELSMINFIFQLSDKFIALKTDIQTSMISKSQDYSTGYKHLDCVDKNAMRSC